MAFVSDTARIVLSSATDVATEEVSSNVGAGDEQTESSSPRSAGNSPRKSEGGASSTEASSSPTSPISGRMRWCDMESEASEDAFFGRDEEEEDGENHAERGAFLGPVVKFGEQKREAAAWPQATAFKETVEEVMQGVAATLRFFWCCSDVICSWYPDQSGGSTCCMQAVMSMEHVQYVQHLASAAKNAIVMRAAQSPSVCLLGCKAMQFVPSPTGFSATFGEMQHPEKACWDSYMYGHCRCTWQHPTSTVTLNFMVMAVASPAPALQQPPQ